MSMPDAIRVLVVDDSAFARKVMREVLEAAPGIKVVDTARDGLDALEKIAALRPDVITLDLVMPHLDGVGLLRQLPPGDRPKVVLVSMSDQDSELVIDALQAGALHLVKKPTALATGRLYELGAELVARVTDAGRLLRNVRVPPPRAPATVGPLEKLSPAHHMVQLVAVGTSTGGPQALTELVRNLKPGLPPVLMALHIPVEYTGALAARLDRLSSLQVIEAADGIELHDGMAVLARGGQHLGVGRIGDKLVTRVFEDEGGASFVPSVDVLFSSAAACSGGSVLGVVLTGMGSDGLEGARAIRAAGGHVLTESAWSCVVDGMPRCVRDAGLSEADVPIERMAAEIERWVMQK